MSSPVCDITLCCYSLLNSIDAYDSVLFYGFVDSTVYVMVKFTLILFLPDKSHWAIDSGKVAPMAETLQIDEDYHTAVKLLAIEPQEGMPKSYSLQAIFSGLHN